MTRLEEIERTYCLNGDMFFGIDFIRGYKLESMYGLSFIGVGKYFNTAKQNCVEVFEIHQELCRKRLLTTKNLN